MKLICITGIDGAGKTTLAENVANLLSVNEYRTVYMYGRVFPILSRALMFLGRIVFLSHKSPWGDYNTYTSDKKKKMRNPFLSWVYTASIYLDYYPQIWIKLLVHRLLGNIVICDRFIFDTIINDLSTHLSYSEQKTDRAIEFNMKLLPKPLQIFLIDLPEEIAFSRKNDIPDINLLRERRGLYLRIKSQPNVIVLDGTRSRNELVEQVMSQIINHKGVAK